MSEKEEQEKLSFFQKMKIAFNFKNYGVKEWAIWSIAWSISSWVTLLQVLAYNTIKAAWTKIVAFFMTLFHILSV